MEEPEAVGDGATNPSIKAFQLGNFGNATNGNHPGEA